MRPALNFLAAAATLTVAQATALSDVCTNSHVKSALPSTDLINGLLIDSSSITTNAVYNASTPGGDYFPAASAYDFCNVTLTYAHPGRNDRVHLKLWMPAPDQFQNRWLSTGGGGFAINHDEQQLPGGVQYGAAAGITDGGFGSFSTQFDQVFLLANGTINYEALYMFGYQAHHELSIIGKALTKNFYGTGNTKLYAYWQGCSEGGREGFSQVQRFQEFDGAVIGAPALRYGQQQANHLYANVVEHTLKYYPPPCELEKIVNLTIAACDRLDGRADGVVSRTDLCKLHFNINSTIGAPYSCPASTTTSGITPAQNGTVSALGAAAARKMLDGLRTLDGRRAYIFYQPSATFDDAQTKYNRETKKFELDVTAYGAEWIPRFLELQNYTLSSLENVTYDTLKDWMEIGWQRYEDVLQTTWPDLTPFQSAGGKVLHYHGESDPSIPAGSSVHYHESVRKTMYPNMSFNESNQALNEWNRLFLVPGAAHCTSSTDQPNGPFPQATLKTLIEWVENKIVPETLNGTVQDGDHQGEQQQICAWPLRPLWKENGTVMNCVYDQASLDTWDYEFDAYRIPLY
ncbi:Tannase/feruloyl esterase [Aspergillus pseudocaelatus]|uniref:Carboxylic ester hydrolase n=1 Tax=Aspergillus pseudocaelatus TaxID=1825620 RepID=A0ABQ6WQY9_9EURO|nr:Tannase/feruloyl esterase [Aspergillus pseudocaelatus]